MNRRLLRRDLLDEFCRNAANNREVFDIFRDHAACGNETTFANTYIIGDGDMSAKPSTTPDMDTPKVIGAVTVRFVFHGVITGYNGAKRANDDLVVEKDFTSTDIGVEADIHMVSDRNALGVVDVNLSGDAQTLATTFEVSPC